MELQNKISTGMLQLKNHDYGEARASFEQAVALEPNDADAHAWLAATYGRLMEQGSMTDKMTLLPLLEREVAKALELSPKSVLAHRVNGLRLIHTPVEFGGSPEQCIVELTYVIDQGEKDAEIYYALGLAYMETGQQEQAADAFTRALELDPTHEAAGSELAQLGKGIAHELD